MKLHAIAVVPQDGPERPSNPVAAEHERNQRGMPNGSASSEVVAISLECAITPCVTALGETENQHPNATTFCWEPQHMEQTGCYRRGKLTPGFGGRRSGRGSPPCACDRRPGDAEESSQTYGSTHRKDVVLDEAPLASSPSGRAGYCQRVNHDGRALRGYGRLAWWTTTSSS